MKILVTNDDGILSDELWILVKELNNIGQIVVVAPDREQSATGTAVTLHQPLRVRKVKPMVPGIETYSVEGTPADSVILALSKLLKDRVDVVVAGINQGLNLGNDVPISGTVGAALQGYLHGFSALAISIERGDSMHSENAAKMAALLTKRIDSGVLPADIFLNVNLPNLPLNQIKGIKTTRLASQSHIDTVEEGHDGKRAYYWLVRHQINQNADRETDIWAVEQGNISITPLRTNFSSHSLPAITDSLCAELFQELKRQ